MYEDSIGEIATKFALNSIYVFGSRASEIARCISFGTAPDPSSHSDVDIAVQPRSGAHLSAQERVQLMQALEDLFGAPRVDLIVLPEANSFLAVDAIRGELLYCFDQDAQAEEELYYLRRAADLAPTRRMRLKSVVLASGSPRRRQLLAALGLEFTIDASDVDETPLPDEAPDALVCRLCRAKAAAVAERHPGEIVLAADTLVVLEGSILGKPADALEAVAMLTALRGRVHVVYTAVCVMNGKAAETRVSATDVRMRAYTDAEIEAYVETGDPLDKAGAYGIQDPQFAPVESWDGCYSAVMGLPMRLAVEMLSRANVVPLREVASACETMTGDRCCMYCADDVSQRSHEHCHQA